VKGARALRTASPDNQKYHFTVSLEVPQLPLAVGVALVGGGGAVCCL